MYLAGYILFGYTDMGIDLGSFSCFLYNGATQTN